jgi:hypothetical protein
MQLYADECFPFGVVEELRRLGHDVLTVHEDNRRGTPDVGILTRAHELSRAVLTHNRRHFQRLHNQQELLHSGIVSATQDPHNEIALAVRIHAQLDGVSPGRWHIRVNRPKAPGQPQAGTASQ